MIRKIVLFIFGLILAAGAGFGGSFLERKISCVEVYRAARTISEHEQICEDDLEIISLPRTLLKSEVLRKGDDLSDLYVKTGMALPYGSLLFQTALEDGESSRTALIHQNEEGMVIYDLSVRDLNTVPVHLAEGMYLDLYLTVSRQSVFSGRLVSGAKVLALYDSSGQRIHDYDSSSQIASLSLSLKEECVIYLNEAAMIGELSIVLPYDPYAERENMLERRSAVFSCLS